MKRIRIVSIDPGVKMIGVAVMNGFDLRYWGTKRIREKGMDRKGILEKTERIVSSLISGYNPDVLLIQRPFYPQQRESKNLREMVKKIKAVGLKGKIKVIDYKPIDVRTFFSNGKRPTKMRQAEVICKSYYPFLTRFLKKDKNKKWWQEKYYIKMFNAVGLGIYYLNNAKICPKDRQVCI